LKYRHTLINISLYRELFEYKSEILLNIYRRRKNASGEEDGGPCSAFLLEWPVSNFSRRYLLPERRGEGRCERGQVAVSRWPFREGGQGATQLEMTG
jgi:hypothetical protein